MLPDRKASNFPEEIKRIREDLKMNRRQFAIFANINRNAPKRFEDRQASNFCIPHPTSWENIKKALYRINYFSASETLDALPIKKIKTDDVIQTKDSIIPIKVVKHPKNFLVTCFTPIIENETC